MRDVYRFNNVIRLLNHTFTAQNAHFRLIRRLGGHRQLLHHRARGDAIFLFHGIVVFFLLRPFQTTVRRIPVNLTHILPNVQAPSLTGNPRPRRKSNPTPNQRSVLPAASVVVSSAEFFPFAKSSFGVNMDANVPLLLCVRSPMKEFNQSTHSALHDTPAVCTRVWSEEMNNLATA